MTDTFRRRLWAGLAFAAVAVMPAVAAAAQRASKVEQLSSQLTPSSIASRPLVLMVALGALALVPFVLLMVTSFVKIAVVLSIVRSALGTQQIPPTQVITGLAIILTIYIMAPVGMDMYRSAGDLVESKGEVMSVQTVGVLVKAADQAKEPMRQFLLKHSTYKDRNMFFSLAKRIRAEQDKVDLTEQDFIVVVPSFVISELKQAFQIGFILFVPFIVIDMVVANILLALGMHMLSPTVISMPFKLLLFVLVDGWYLITKGLVISYI
ncbi:MAG TPA: EscR/YscR/HrcR family type III secretion system export apparatus protein [Myxococcales bacterium]|jgi:type III secretion protein R|nr:EscR/YscR/HrcR family type III secretion system export apparatus protein [Myxococcales bacterium]